MLLHVYFSPALLCAFLIEGKANLFLGTGRWMFETAHKSFHLFIFAISKTHIRSFAKPYKSLLVPLRKKFEIKFTSRRWSGSKEDFLSSSCVFKTFPPFFFSCWPPLQWFYSICLHKTSFYAYLYIGTHAYMYLKTEAEMFLHFQMCIWMLHKITFPHSFFEQSYQTVKPSMS